MWSCGVYLFIMLAAAFPFARPSDEQLTPANKLHAVLQVTNAFFSCPKAVETRASVPVRPGTNSVQQQT